MLAVFHLSVCALNAYTLWYDQMYVDLAFVTKEANTIPFRGRPMFATIWCLVIQTVYFGLAFLNDIVGSNASAPKNPPLIRKIKDTLFSVAFPIAIYISTFFWGLYAVDKDLIFPDEIAIKFPPWLNHVMHTLIVPFAFGEMLFSKITLPSRKVGLIGFLGIGIVYTIWINIVFMVMGEYPYPFLSLAPWPVRILIFLTSLSILSPVVYLLCERLYYFTNPRRPKAEYNNGHSNGYKKH